MKKYFILILLLIIANVQVSAKDTTNTDDINMTPRTMFSGYNDNSARNIYPKLNSINNETESRTELMKPKSVRELKGAKDLSTDKNAPINYNQFPQNVDSSNMLHLQGIQNGIQNMYMGF